MERKCGLNVSISSLRNLAKQVTPTIGGISNDDAFIALGAAVEIVAETILHKSVGAMISSSLQKPSLDVPDAIAFKKTGKLTLTKDHVNVALHYMINTDQIQGYSSHEVFSHRRLDYETELKQDLEKNSKRALNFRSKKRRVKERVKERVEDTNERGLLNAQEIISFLVHDNTLPLLFMGLNLADTKTLVDIRSGAVTDRMKRKYKTLISGDGIMQADRTMLATMNVLWKEVAEGEDAQAWYAHHRK